jgi:hypothetical protein
VTRDTHSPARARLQDPGSPRHPCAMPMLAGEDDAVAVTAMLELDTVRSIDPADPAARCRIYAGGLSAERFERWLVAEKLGDARRWPACPDRVPPSLPLGANARRIRRHLAHRLDVRHIGHSAHARCAVGRDALRTPGCDAAVAGSVPPAITAAFNARARTCPAPKRIRLAPPPPTSGSSRRLLSSVYPRNAFSSWSSRHGYAGEGSAT